MKILIFSESINVEDSSASKGRVALILNLLKCGYEIKVLHFSHKEIQLKGVECVFVRENRFSIYFLLSRFVRVFQRVFQKLINQHVEGFFGFSFTHFNDSKTIAKAIRTHLDFNPDLILTLSKGASFRPHKAMLYLPELHSKWMAYIHDPYPYHFYPRPFNKVEPGYDKKEKFMREVIEKATFLSFPSLMLKEWLQSYFPAIENKSFILPHQITGDFEEKPIPDFFEKDKFSLLHAGNLLKERTPEFLVKGFVNFLENNPVAKTESKLYLIGKYHHHVNKLKPYLTSQTISVQNYTDYHTVQSIEKKASVNIILESISEISPFLPGKFPNCVKANKPILVLGPYYSEVRRLLGKDYPYWSEANDIEKIELQITKLYNLWKENPKQFILNREDLVNYCNEKSLKVVFDSLNSDT